MSGWVWRFNLEVVRTGHMIKIYGLREGGGKVFEIKPYFGI